MNNKNLDGRIVAASPIAERDPKLFTVIYEHAHEMGWKFYRCIAHTAEGAEFQCAMQFLGATVLWVNEGMNETQEAK